MGILNKILFWKKDEEFDFDNIAEKESSAEHYPSSQDPLEKPLFPQENPAQSVFNQELSNKGTPVLSSCKKVENCSSFQKR